VNGSDTSTGELALAAVRHQVLSDPDAAVRMLLRQQRRGYAADRCSLLSAAVWHGVLAEGYLRLNAAEAAFDTVLEAMNACIGAADRIGNEDVPHMLPLVAVWADLAVYVGHEDAPFCCRSYQLLAERGGDERRMLAAGALRAVAVYHREDGDRGSDRLAQVLYYYRSVFGDDPISQMMAEALCVMADGLTDGCYRLTALQAHRLPVPGGRLCPDVAVPRRYHLASRVGLHLPARPAGSPGEPS
jgi:hypothetical protein